MRDLLSRLRCVPFWHAALFVLVWGFCGPYAYLIGALLLAWATGASGPVVAVFWGVCMAVLFGSALYRLAYSRSGR